MMVGRKGFSLRLMLSMLVTVSVLITALAAGYTAVQANITSLSAIYLENNYQYARKLSLNANDLLKGMQQNIESIAAMTGSHSLTQQQLDIWYHANRQNFNSIFIADASLSIQAISPDDAGMAAGTRLTSEIAVRAAELKRSFISEPYISETGRVILLISSPIFNETGDYAGFAGGTIYLEEDNGLSRLLGEHFYGDGSYVFVVDKNGHLISHPNKARLNEAAADNPMIRKVISGENGSLKLINSLGIEYFAGYAYEPNSGWGIVSQTPTSVLSEPIKNLIIRAVIQAFPLLIVIVLLAWFVSYRISKPLHQLAKFSEEALLQRKAVPSKTPKIDSRIYEVKQLQQGVNNHFKLIREEIQMDGLTALANRKTFDIAIQDWLDNKVPCSLILLDIDHFKRINDTFGHLIGDEVLKYVAATMRTSSRDKDLCFRYGGEEFGILLNNCDLQAALLIAERLREKLENSISPTGDQITISIGISTTDNMVIEPKELIAMADTALYQSKAEGRNKTTVFSAVK
ncbi:sensor domain-containing diguanylate cyclase [Paenibacillus abyssi]|uniref:Cell signaling regulator n=1 Tax=Paenibacillus abyssi TaxID=1340531 RepID=A0A917FXB2_9BACL|nr:sensor domain-containing diguanylate cyclase [Paenibacillus abyssi]GGG13702.1 cell signaling regulator [Paenibacillus abyssi]